jgi:hypothetical protein
LDIYKFFITEHAEPEAVDFPAIIVERGIAPKIVFLFQEGGLYEGFYCQRQVLELSLRNPCESGDG